MNFHLHQKENDNHTNFVIQPQKILILRLQVQVSMFTKLCFKTRISAFQIGWVSKILNFYRNMEDLGFFPYPSSFSTGFHDEILDPGPTSFFLKDPHGEDVLLGQGLDQLQAKLGLSIFEEDKGSPVNVDDNDWLMRDLSGNILFLK